LDLEAVWIVPGDRLRQSFCLSRTHTHTNDSRITQVYGVETYKRGDGFTNAQCTFISSVIYPATMIDRHDMSCSVSKRPRDDHEHRVYIPGIHLLLAGSTHNRICRCEHDTIQNRPLLVSGIFLRRLCCRAQRFDHVDNLLGYSQRVGPDLRFNLIFEFEFDGG
jgi:hypothetical protein